MFEIAFGDTNPDELKPLVGELLPYVWVFEASVAVITKDFVATTTSNVTEPVL
jgi:hypothetical protein